MELLLTFLKVVGIVFAGLVLFLFNSLVGGKNRALLDAFLSDLRSGDSVRGSTVPIRQHLIRVTGVVGLLVACAGIGIGLFVPAARVYALACLLLLASAFGLWWSLRRRERASGPSHFES